MTVVCCGVQVSVWMCGFVYVSHVYYNYYDCNNYYAERSFHILRSARVQDGR